MTVVVADSSVGLVQNTCPEQLPVIEFRHEVLQAVLTVI